MEIIRLDKRVSPSSRSSRIKFLRCHRASFSWFADFSQRHDASRIAREQIFDVIFLPALCPFVRPLVGSFSSDPIPGEFPLLVTSFSASPVPVLFSQPAGYFSLLLSSFLLSVAVTYYLPFIPYHLLMRIDSLPLLSLFPGYRNLAFPSVLYLDLFTLSALKFVVMKLWWNMKFGIYSSPACDLFKFYIWLFTLSASNFPSSCSFAFTSGFPEFSTIAFERNSHRSVYFVSPFLSRRSC